MEWAENKRKAYDGLQSKEYSNENADNRFIRYIKTDLAIATAILIGTQAFTNIVDIAGLHQSAQVPENICMSSNVQYGVGIGKRCGMQNEDVQEIVREVLELQAKSNVPEKEEILPSSDEIKNYEAAAVSAAGWRENETTAPVDMPKEATGDIFDGTIQNESNLQIEVPEEKVSDAKVLDAKITDEKIPNVTADETTEEIAKNASDTSENMLEELTTIGSFAVNKDGIIEKCMDPYAASVDDTIIIPTDEKCTGIGATAFDGIGEISEVMEVYIPANITYIDSAAFERLSSLIYIEVSEENPTYKSIEGVLYDREGNVVVYPAGREEDA